MQNNCSNELTQLEYGDKTIFDTGERRSLGRRDHGLGKLLCGEVKDPEAESRNGEEGEEYEC
jgi:hypothetical protein